MTVTYADGTPIHVGDIVRRSKTSKATYVINRIVDLEGEPVVWLGPCSGYTSASVFGTAAIQQFIKEETR